MKRLTVNPGLRVQWIETGMYESSMAAGRFVPARFIEEEKGLIDFGADYSPRLSAVYDLFGNGRTAFKTQLEQVLPELRRRHRGRTPTARPASAARRVSGSTSTSFRARTPAGSARPMPGVRHFRPIATASRRTTRSAPARAAANFANPDAPDRMPVNLQRQYNDEFTAGVQHQVMPRLAVGAMFYKRKIADMCVRGSAAHHAWPTARDSNIPDCRDIVARPGRRGGRGTERDGADVQPESRRRLDVFNSGVIDSSDTDERHAVYGLRGVVQHAASGRRDAVRQLDDGTHASAMVRHRRQPERPDVDRTVQRQRCHDRSGASFGGRYLRPDDSSTIRSGTNSSWRETTRSRTASTSAPCCRATAGQESVISVDAGSGALSRTRQRTRPTRSF